MKLSSRSSLLVFFLICGGIIATTQIISIITTVPPSEASRDTLWTLFISLFVFCGATLTLIWHGIKKLFFRLTISSRLLISMRQGFLASGIITISCFLHTLKLLTIWNFVPLVVAALLIEFFFQAERRPYASLTS